MARHAPSSFAGSVPFSRSTARSYRHRVRAVPGVACAHAAPCCGSLCAPPPTRKEDKGCRVGLCAASSPRSCGDSTRALRSTLKQQRRSSTRSAPRCDARETLALASALRREGRLKAVCRRPLPLGALASSRPSNTGDKLRSGARVHAVNRRGHEAALPGAMRPTGYGAAESFVSFIPLLGRTWFRPRPFAVQPDEAYQNSRDATPSTKARRPGAT